MSRLLLTAWVIILSLVCISHNALAEPTPRYKAVAFDYFVIFNPNSIIPVAEQIFPGKGDALVKGWRAKQFEYGYLRSITSNHKDFFRVTEDALIYTVNVMGLELTPQNQKKLLDAYLHLELWPDAKDALKKLKSSGMKIITIANFSSHMLQSNADNAGITNLFDELLSTEVNSTYKPDPHAYELGMKRLGLEKKEIVFAAFGGWDAYGAKSFGYPTYWVNRFNLPVERLDIKADGTSNNIQGLVDFVLAAK